MAASCAAAILGPPADNALAHEYLVESSPLAGSANLKASKQTGTYTFTAVSAGVNVRIQCTSVGVTGTISTAGASETTLEFVLCTVSKPANCTVKAPIALAVTDQVVEVAGVLEDELKLAGTTITLEGASCVLKAKPFTLEGKQRCSWDESHATEQVQHSIKCATTGSELKPTATFAGTTILLELESLLHWAIV